MVLDIWRGLGGRTDPEFDRCETMPFIEGARCIVLLMGTCFEPVRRKLFGQANESRSPAFAPLTRINIQPIKIRPIHGKVGNDVAVERTNPNQASCSNDIVEYKFGRFNCQRLPRRQIGVGG